MYVCEEEFTIIYKCKCMQQVISGTTGGNVYTYGRGGAELLAPKIYMYVNKGTGYGRQNSDFSFELLQPSLQ